MIGSFTISSGPAWRRRRASGARCRRRTRATNHAAASQTRISANRTVPSAVRLDGDGPQEFLVLRRQLGGGLAAALLAREEDPGVGAAPEDLLHGVPRRLGRLERHLDGLQALLQQEIHVAFSRHRDHYDTIPAQWPPGGRVSPPPPFSRAASSPSARTSCGSPAAAESSIPCPRPAPAAPSRPSS